MSSFYNRPTSAQQPAFQFDRVYTSRKELEDNFDKDGVMVGRYVAVIYGAVEPHLAYAKTTLVGGQESLQGWYYSYTRDNNGDPYFTHPVEPIDGDIYENLIAPDLKSKYWYIKNGMWHQAKVDMTGLTPADPAYEYLTNLFQDLNANYVPCPNSVFIKLYSKDKRGMYYKEIASLNEYLPSLDLVMEAPTYDAYEANTWPVVTDRVEEASMNAPFIYKTGLHYNIHIVQPAIYVPGTVNEYNKEGFNANTRHYMVYSNAANSPVKDHYGIYYESQRKRWFPYNAASLDPGTTQENNDQRQRTDKYSVEADFHEIGNAVSDMWDRFYGRPAQETSVTQNGVTTTTGTRDTQINYNYAQYLSSRQAGATQGRQDNTTMRGVINSILALIGYDERTTDDPNDYSEENCNQKTNNVIWGPNGQLTYWPGGEYEVDGAGNVIKDTRRIKFNRDTLRGLIAEGSANADLILGLQDTIAAAEAALQQIYTLLGVAVDDQGNPIEWPDATTVHALVNYILTQVALAQQYIGAETDMAPNQNTLWGLYNLLKTVDISQLIDLIGAASKLPTEKSILERLSILSGRVDQLEQRGSYWINDNGVMIPDDSFSEIKIVKQKLTATNTNNKVRGAMWAQ